MAVQGLKRVLEAWWMDVPVWLLPTFFTSLEYAHGVSCYPLGALAAGKNRSMAVYICPSRNPPHIQGIGRFPHS